jgi:hypothetical protein
VHDPARAAAERGQHDVDQDMGFGWTLISEEDCTLPPELRPEVGSSRRICRWTGGPGTAQKAHSETSSRDEVLGRDWHHVLDLARLFVYSWTEGHARCTLGKR